jgi:hypothetical protein
MLWGEPKMQLSDEELTKMVLVKFKVERSCNPRDFYAYEIKEKGLDVNKEQVFEVFHKLFISNVIRVSEGSQINEWYTLTEYGKTVVGEISEFIFLEPNAYVAAIKASAPNIEDVTLRYVDESIRAYKGNLLLSATVMVGCASEDSILSLISSFCKYIQDPTVDDLFDKGWSIKAKYDLLKKVYNDRKVRRKAEQEAAKLGLFLSEKQKNYLLEFETIIDSLFDIHRINRNDAGHPTGREMDSDALKANLATFKRYAETTYGIKNIFDELVSTRT